MKVTKEIYINSTIGSTRVAVLENQSIVDSIPSLIETSVCAYGDVGVVKVLLRPCIVFFNASLSQKQKYSSQDQLSVPQGSSLTT